MLESLSDRWSIELVAGSESLLGGRRVANVERSFYRQTLRFVSSSIFLDRFEPWSRRRFGGWQPEAAAALLIGFPFSPLVYASRRLAERGIPYVVDAGDPWVITAEWPELRGLGRLRALSAERRLWSGAAGGIVTTESQAEALRTIFPKLEILVRPNGFAPMDQSAATRPTEQRAPGSDSVLRLAHFGDISSDRLSVTPFLEGLAQSGIWSKIEFHQYGSDWTRSLGRLDNVRVFFHDPRAWSEVVAAATEYDLAVVIGNRDPRLLPSKAVVYLQLPIPRLALVEDEPTNALAHFVADKPGWVIARPDGPEVAETIRSHLSRGWSTSELAPPARESWGRVCEEIGQFLERVLDRRDSETASVRSRTD
jgi:hypothetical protein